MILQSIKLKLDAVIRWFLIILMALMTINVLWQVFTRFILQDPSSFTEELARYMLIWLGVLGAGYVAGQKMHLAIDLLSLKLKSVNKSILEIVIQLFIFLFSLFALLVGGLNLVHITLSLNQISAALQIPLGYVYTVLPLSGAIMMFYSVYYIIEEINKIKNAKING